MPTNPSTHSACANPPPLPLPQLLAPRTPTMDACPVRMPRTHMSVTLESCIASSGFNSAAPLLTYPGTHGCSKLQAQVAKAANSDDGHAGAWVPHVPAVHNGEEKDMQLIRTATLDFLPFTPSHEVQVAESVQAETAADLPWRRYRAGQNAELNDQMPTHP